MASFAGHYLTSSPSYLLGIILQVFQVICWALSYKFAKCNFEAQSIHETPSPVSPLAASRCKCWVWNRSSECPLYIITLVVPIQNYKLFVLAFQHPWVSYCSYTCVHVFSDILQTINLLPGDGTFCFIPNLFCILSNFMQAMRFLVFRFCSPNNSIYFRR